MEVAVEAEQLGKTKIKIHEAIQYQIMKCVQYVIGNMLIV